MASQPRNSAAVKGKISCDVCGKWKLKDEYSNVSLKKYLGKLGRGATPARSGVRCRRCTGEQQAQIRCQGPCHRVLDGDLFSTNSKRQGKNWCLECTEWQLATEQGRVLPPPGAHRDANDLQQLNSSSSPYVSNYTSTSATRQTPTTSDMESVTSRMNSASIDFANVRQGSNLRDDYLFDYDDDASTVQDDRTTVSHGSSVYTSAQSQTLPHESDRDKAPVPYNAWGPDGKKVQMMKTPTVVSESLTTGGASSNVRVAQEKVEVDKNGWAKVSSRKQFPHEPSYLQSLPDNSEPMLSTSARRPPESDDDIDSDYD